MLENLLDRRSIRKYKSDPLPEPLVTQLLTAAMYAPSARDQRPWHFIAVDDRAVLSEIIRNHPYAAFLAQAPMVVVVCGDSDISGDYWPVDCAAATQNLLLAAHELGLGSCWCGVYPRPERREALDRIFRLPKSIHSFSLVVLGYPAEQRPRPERFDRSRVHRNAW